MCELDHVRGQIFALHHKQAADVRDRSFSYEVTGVKCPHLPIADIAVRRKTWRDLDGVTSLRSTEARLQKI
jgi:hypothetical protein